MAKKTKAPIKSILISQPKPQGRSPYDAIGKKFKVNIDFMPFIEVEGVTLKEFRKARTNPNHFKCVIFMSRNAMDHFFRICAELRVTMSQETKYFCKSEAIALYLQKHIQYRKRKVFYGDGTVKSFKEMLLKYKKAGKILFICSDKNKGSIPTFLAENDFEFKEAILFKTVPSDLSEFDVSDYDLMAFFSPYGVHSLQHNFPSYKQQKTHIAAFGPQTCQAVEEAGMRLDLQVPSKEYRSMSEAISRYLEAQG